MQRELEDLAQDILIASRQTRSSSRHHGFHSNGSGAGRKGKGSSNTDFTPCKRDLLHSRLHFVVSQGSRSSSLSLKDSRLSSLVPWEDILQLSTDSLSTGGDGGGGLAGAEICPICLDTPAFPQLSSCGHVFCWPCFLRCLWSSSSSGADGGPALSSSASASGGAGGAGGAA